MPLISIREASGDADIATIRALMRAYGNYLADHPGGAASICLKGYEAELDNLPAPYASLLIAEVDHSPAGCVAIKLLHPATVSNELACEIKRLWVDPAFRGHQLGRRLMDAAIAWARTHNLNSIYLDTVPAAMPEANRLYAALGFEVIPRYNENPVADLQFFRLAL
jgi:GNAT superfamily N-acetyltransferase